MGKEPKKRGKLKQKLLNKYRLVVLNEETYEEQLYFRLTRLNVMIISILLISVFVTGTVLLIASTPLKEFIPGYSSTAMRAQAAENAIKLDSLNRAYDQSIRYLNSIQQVLVGDLKFDELNESPITLDSFSKRPKAIVSMSIDDSLLRAMVDQEDKYNFQGGSKSKINFVLFPPAQGDLSQTYDPTNKHYAVDIVLKENAPIKAVADGTVIFSEWTAGTGHVIIIEHPFGLISAYKHNASLSKQQGDYVVAGEVIASAGNTGELSTGWHLHFELWSDGYPMNPESFIDFSK
ncbi:M23 family metallopeptidase [Flavobacteriaceae bacterium]|nr:M23 family metallopeptidase [Flavobacteriaceae bacterium]MDB4067213.1 M23 family metallopeptidase [Flavobacteriaceae bacterium]MDB4152702.1 M23 family metallopeptidase [Flavobacteriaceae bacterium]|tara:strand:+ start:2939 stop:3811 length:873 start_codon:yes stop_codon:yes gene_type:complete